MPSFDPTTRLRLSHVAARGKRNSLDVAAFLLDKERACLALQNELEQQTCPDSEGHAYRARPITFPPDVLANDDSLRFS